MGDSGSSRKVANSLVAVSSAAVLAVYGAGYARTRAAADRLAAHASERRPHIPLRRDSGPVPAADAANEARLKADPTNEEKTSPVGLKPETTIEKNEIRLKTDLTTDPKALPATEAKATPAPGATSETTTEKSAPVRLKADPPTEAKTVPTTEAKTDATNQTYVGSGFSRSDNPVGSGFSRTNTAASDTASPNSPAASTPSAAADAAPTASAAASKYKDGTYLGWGSCRHGDIQVSVVVEAGRITAARVAQCLTRYSCSWVDPIPPVIIKQQGTTYDYVSGATESSDAFQDAVADALSHAQ